MLLRIISIVVTKLKVN